MFGAPGYRDVSRDDSRQYRQWGRRGFYDRTANGGQRRRCASEDGGVIGFMTAVYTRSETAESSVLCRRFTRGARRPSRLDSSHSTCDSPVTRLRGVQSGRVWNSEVIDIRRENPRLSSWDESPHGSQTPKSEGLSAHTTYIWLPLRRTPVVIDGPKTGS